MTQDKINQIREAAYCKFAAANAQLIQNEWRGVDCGCKWKDLYKLLLRLEALDRSPLSGEDLYNEYVTVASFSLPALANNTAPTASLTNNCSDTTTGKVQALSTVLVDGRTAYDGVLQLITFDVDGDQYVVTGGVTNFSGITTNLDTLMLSRGLDLDMAGSTITEKTDINQFRSATNNCGTAKNGTILGATLTSNYNYNQSDFTADTTVPLSGVTVNSILSFTVDGGSLGTVTYTFAPALDPTDTNAVIDAFIDLFGVNKVSYNQNGDINNFIADFRFKMTELTKGGPTSYITFDTSGGPIQVPVTVDPGTIGNGTISLDYIINTNQQLSGGIINTINDALQAQWTCTITQCDGADELVSINIDGVDIPFTTPFTMSSGPAVGIWLSANAGAGAFTSAWNGTQLTISRVSYTSATHPRYVSWRRVVPYDYGDPLLLSVAKVVAGLPAGYQALPNTKITIWWPGAFYGKEFELCYGDGGVPGQGNIYLAEYLNGVLQQTPLLLYTSPYNPWSPPQTYETVDLSYHVSTDRLIFAVNSYASGGIPPTNLQFYSIDSAYAINPIAYVPTGPIVFLQRSPFPDSLQNWNQATSDHMYTVRCWDASPPTTYYREVVVIDPTATSATAVISEASAFTPTEVYYYNVVYDTYNNFIWVLLYNGSQTIIKSFDAFTYAAGSTYNIDLTTYSNSMAYFSTSTGYYLLIERSTIFGGGVNVFDLVSLTLGTPNFGLSDPIFAAGGSTYLAGITQNGYAVLSRNFPQRSILIGQSETIEFYSNFWSSLWQINPYTQYFTGIAFTVANDYILIGSILFSGDSESDQDSPFNIGEAASFSQTIEPVLATEDNKCLSDDAVNSVAYQVNLVVDTCCGSTTTTTTTTVTPPVPSYTIYYGSSNNGALNDAGISALTPLVAQTFAAIYAFASTAPDPQYKYVAFPSSLGTPLSIIDTSNGYPVVMNTTYTVTISSVQYSVYRTFNELGGAINIQFNS